MKNVSFYIALLAAGWAAGSMSAQVPPAYTLGEEVSIHTITVPEANVQAHFACQRLIPSGQ